MLTGENIILREISLNDTDNIISWRNNPNVKKFFCIQKDLTREEHINWFNTMIKPGKVKQFIIVDKTVNKDIGSVYLRDIDYKNLKAEYGIFIGEDYCRGHGIGSEAAKLILDYGFNVLNLHKIFLRAFEENFAAIKSYRKVGFEVEGIFKDDIRLEEKKYINMIFMSIINKQQ